MKKPLQEHSPTPSSSFSVRRTLLAALAASPALSAFAQFRVEVSGVGLTQLPIALWDERLYTAVVERELIAANVTRARRAKVIDQHAAVFILQGALDRLARGVMAH